MASDIRLPTQPSARSNAWDTGPSEPVTSTLAASAIRICEDVVSTWSQIVPAHSSQPSTMGPQVVAVEVAVAGHAGIGHSAVEVHLHLEFAGPVRRQERRLQAGEMRVVHRDQASLGDLDHPPGRVAEASLAGENPAPCIKLLAVVEDAGAGKIEPLSAVDAKPHRQPVRDIDQILVLHRAARDDRVSRL